MNDVAKVGTNLGFLLIIISIVFIFTDLQLLVSHWHELFAHDFYKMIGSGLPSKEVLFYNIFRWLLLLIGGIGIVNKNVLGWIFIQAFILLTFCTAAIILLSDFFSYKRPNWNYFSTVIVTLSMMIFVFKLLNMNMVKVYLGVGKYQKTWLWSGILTLNFIGIVILEA